MSISDKRLAILSVSDKRGIEDFARALLAAGYELLSTGGTALSLAQAGLPVTEISAYTGSPELLDGRVKTLHPKIHAGILALRSNPDHLAVLEREGIRPIDLVAVNLYPFRERARRHSRITPEVLESIDIGGVALLRAAAKNFSDVAVLCDPRDYPALIAEMGKSGGDVALPTRRRLAAKVFRLTAEYDAAIAECLAGKESAGILPPRLALDLPLRSVLRYGENPHQAAAFYAAEEEEGTSLARARLLQGKELSYNNLLDLESALALALELPGTSAAIVKHNNPCGVASAGDLRESYLRARATDPVSAFGGVIAFSAPVDGATAKEVVSAFVEAVIAPSFAPEALEVFAGKKNLRVLETGSFQPREPAFLLRSVSGGILLQEEDRLGWREDGIKVVTRRAPTAGEWEGLSFAWIVCKHVRSNAIVLGKGRATVGIGAGQMSRIDSAELAIRKAKQAGMAVKGSVLASDAFFPFPDVVELAAREGIAAVVQPGGSIRDQESIRAADAAGLAMVFTGVRHFRH
jgi:phosphoribosylaminoimidazolecarboxamide formyltransferase/IMP cyclohydrolase